MKPYVGQLKECEHIKICIRSNGWQISGHSGTTQPQMDILPRVAEQKRKRRVQSPKIFETALHFCFGGPANIWPVAKAHAVAHTSAINLFIPCNLVIIYWYDDLHIILWWSSWYDIASSVTNVELYVLLCYQKEDPNKRIGMEWCSNKQIKRSPLTSIHNDWWTGN